MRCVVCGRRDADYGNHKCPESVLRRRERQERAEERRVEEWTIRDEEREEES
jgi:ferredoxin